MQKFVVDYSIHFIKANGKSKPKVFKLKNVALEAFQSLILKKPHSIKLITTRKYYSGKHKVELLINGKVVSENYFYLECF